jgi:hypothetical protein
LRISLVKVRSEIIAELNHRPTVEHEKLEERQAIK